MARYYQRPNNPIVDLTPKVPIEFYSNLINQAQQNLNQANVTGAAFMTDAYNQKFVDQAARDRAMALGQAPIEQALDRDFVTPAAMAKAVTQASAAMADWKNVNAKHLELVEREQKLRDTWRGNYIGNSVLNEGLLKEDGTFKSADELNLVASNVEDLREAFKQDLAAKANQKRSGKASGWYTTAGGKMLARDTSTILGMTDAEVDEMIQSGVYKKYGESMPELRKAVEASLGKDATPEKVDNFLKDQFSKWSYTNLVMGELKDQDHMGNPDYQPGGYTTDTEAFNPLSYQEMMEQGEDAQKYLTKWGAKEYGNLRALGKSLGQSISLAKGYKRTAFEEFKDQANELNPDLYKEAFKLYPNNREKAVDYFVDNLYKEKLAFDRGEINTKGRVFAKSTSWDINISNSDNGIVRTMFQNPTTVIKSADGKHETTLGAAAGAKSLVKVRDDGNLIVTDDKNKYVWNTTDPVMLATLPTQVQPIINMQKKLYDARWEAEPTKEIYPTNVSDRYYHNGQPTDIIGKVAYRVEPSGTKDANRIIKMIVTDKIDASGEPIWYEQEIDFDEVAKTSSIALMKILESEKMSTTGTAKQN